MARSQHNLGILDVNVGAEYTEDEKEFLMAMERWMRKTGRRFPTFTEVLAVARSLGYRKESLEKEHS